MQQLIEVREQVSGRSVDMWVVSSKSDPGSFFPNAIVVGDFLMWMERNMWNEELN